ncbi:MAG TPA: hypothetical protein DE313_07575 [Ruminococcus sp.]|nr:hypothetical protein [Ruminococcus sp.]
MRTIKKQISVLLAVLMVLSSIMTVSFSVSAAETTGGTVTVKSNLCDSEVYNYTASDKQIQVKYYLQCDKKILNMQGGIYYDSSVLKVADTNTEETCIPAFVSGNAFINFDLTNKALFNATNLNLYDFTSQGVFVTVTFDIIGSGDTEVNLDVDVITATTANSYLELKGASDIDLVYYGNIAADKFAFSSDAKVIPDETKDVSVFGDIDLALADNGSGVYTGVTDLEAGTYTFKINNMGTTYCSGATFTDKTAGTIYNSKWTSATTLKASGGTYTFKYDTTTNKLIIEYKAPSRAQIFGDINLDLQATKDANIYSGEIELEAGKYSFRVMNQGVQYCGGYTFNDITLGAKYNSKWTSASTLNAKGGTYTISYDIDANMLSITYVPTGAECGIVGDITLSLDATTNEKVYSATTEVEAGTYQLKVSNFGKNCGSGATIKNSTNGVVLNPKWSKYLTFVATGGTYTFTYNIATNTLAIIPEKAETVVKVTGGIDLTLAKSADENVYTGTTTLNAGTFTFKMNVDGTDYCCGATIKNATTGLSYKSKYTSSSTLIATGGTYTFTYNVATNVLSVAYAK